MLQISAKELIKVLQKLGFVFVSQKGSHIKLRKEKPIRKNIIIPNHKVIRPGTLNNILKRAEINQKELEKLTK
jgi:predicted RNA binding protein YcfA (HicA-like mRNA interferase family)